MFSFVECFVISGVKKNAVFGSLVFSAEGMCRCGLEFVHTQVSFFYFFSLDSKHELYFVVLQPAAMFKVLRTDPPIPDNLSPEGKDFLRCCFKRIPTERPTASKLLEHPFIQTLNHYSPHSVLHSFLGNKSPVSFLPFSFSHGMRYPTFQLKRFMHVYNWLVGVRILYTAVQEIKYPGKVIHV